MQNEYRLHLAQIFVRLLIKDDRLNGYICRPRLLISTFCTQYFLVLLDSFFFFYLSRLLFVLPTSIIASQVKQQEEDAVATVAVAIVVIVVVVIVFVFVSWAAGKWSKFLQQLQRQATIFVLLIKRNSIYQHTYTYSCRD